MVDRSIEGLQEECCVLLLLQLCERCQVCYVDDLTLPVVKHEVHPSDNQGPQRIWILSFVIGLKLAFVEHMIHLKLDNLIVVFSQNLHESLMILGPLSFAGDVGRYLF